MWLHRFARLVVVATFLLVVAGGLVTSTGSGLAVPDWPTTYGSSTFSFPLSRMVGDVFFQQGHRLVATAVGILVILLTAFVWRSDERPSTKVLAAAALLAVVVQGVLGGLGVLYLLPAPVSISHASLAHVVFGVTVAIALLTSPGWRGGYLPPQRADGTRALAAVGDARLVRLTMVSLLAVYLQIVLGAAVRHSEAALAIPDYPLAFGGLLPPLDRLSSLPVAIHFAHRLGAVALAVVLVITTWRAWMHHGDRVELRRPAALLVGLLLSKIILGGLIVLSGRNVLVSTAHVASGALLFGAALVLALRASRPFFGEALQPAPAAAVRVVKSGRR